MKIISPAFLLALGPVLGLAACGSSSPSLSTAGNPYLQGTPTTRMYTAWEVSQDGTIVLEITQPSPPASWPVLNLTPDLGGPYTQETASPSDPRHQVCIATYTNGNAWQVDVTDSAGSDSVAVGLCQFLQNGGAQVTYQSTSPAPTTSPSAAPTATGDPASAFASEGMPPGASTEYIGNRYIGPQVVSEVQYLSGEQLAIGGLHIPPTLAEAQRACLGALSTSGPGAQQPDAVLSWYLGCVAGNGRS